MFNTKKIVQWIKNGNHNLSFEGIVKEKIEETLSRLYLKKTISFLMFILFVPVTAAAEKVIIAWTYYQSPPFITKQGQGLSYDFIDLLNKHTQGKYRFQIVVYPRKRVDKHLESGKQGIVMFVNWEWMKDKDKTKYLWGPVILADQNEIISRAEKKLKFDGTAESLSGLRFGGILGRYYVGLEEAIKQKAIHRSNAKTVHVNIKLLLDGWIDFTSMPNSMLNYHLKKMALKEKLYISPTPLYSYTRHILVTKQLQTEHEILTQFVKDLPKSADWKNILKKYGL